MPLSRLTSALPASGSATVQGTIADGVARFQPVHQQRLLAALSEGDRGSVLAAGVSGKVRLPDREVEAAEGDAHRPRLLLPRQIAAKEDRPFPAA